MISLEVPNPQATIRALDGHLVEVQSRGKRQPVHRGVIRGCGEKGFSLDLADGIGGRVIFYYFEVLSVKDLEPEVHP